MKLLKVLGILVAVVAILLAVAAAMLNTNSVQNWLMQRAVELLKEQLQTEVSVGHVNVNLFKGNVTLNNVEVDDRQGRKMLQVERFTAALDLDALLRKEVIVTDAKISGVKAMLCKPDSPADSTANFQFIIEAFKSKDGRRSHSTHQDKKEISFHLKTATIDIDSLCYITDNGRPRRNTGKPNHGAFDGGHLDICTAMTATVHCSSDTLQPVNCELCITNCIDRGSGLQVDSLCLKADISKDSLLLSDVEIRMPHTQLSFAKAKVLLPDSTAGRSLQYNVPLLTATTQIRDIAKPFAPVLKNFTTPLQVQCAFSGNADGMDFKDVKVATADRQLHINASGRIRELLDKDRLHVHFDIGQMTAFSGISERIISHFPVKKYMMKQLRALGRIGYKGYFDVLKKKESFTGRLRTEHGAINFHFDIDEQQKYLSGTASTDSLELGRIMDMKNLGRIACRTDFRFDISKPRTAKIRQKKGGKLPIGSLEAEVTECHYKFIALHHLSASIVSDGVEATGKVMEQGKFINVYTNFSFTNTDQMQKLKVKPGIGFHHKKDKKDKKEKKEKKSKKTEKDSKSARKKGNDTKKR